MTFDSNKVITRNTEGKFSEPLGEGDLYFVSDDIIERINPEGLVTNAAKVIRGWLYYFGNSVSDIRMQMVKAEQGYDADIGVAVYAGDKKVLTPSGLVDAQYLCPVIFPVVSLVQNNVFLAENLCMFDYVPNIKANTLYYTGTSLKNLWENVLYKNEASIGMIKGLFLCGFVVKLASGGTTTVKFLYPVPEEKLFPPKKMVVLGLGKEQIHTSGASTFKNKKFTFDPDCVWDSHKWTLPQSYLPVFCVCAGNLDDLKKQVEQFDGSTVYRMVKMHESVSGKLFCLSKGGTMRYARYVYPLSPDMLKRASITKVIIHKSRILGPDDREYAVKGCLYYAARSKGELIHKLRVGETALQLDKIDHNLYSNLPYVLKGGETAGYLYPDKSLEWHKDAEQVRRIKKILQED